VIDLYAITDDPAPPLPEPLSAVSSHGLAVVCGPAEDGDVTAEVLWRHEEVVEALMEERDLLPVRFGTRVDDEAAAARALGDRHEDLAGALDRVRGAVELSVRVIGNGGGDDLREKAATAALVHGPLSQEARASTELIPRERSELLRAAYLVDRARVDSFVDHVARLQAANPRLRLLCTGPWPPYSFAET
jgi:Gas vesicle synthesis protein GvpL/GvpF